MVAVVNGSGSRALCDCKESADQGVAVLESQVDGALHQRTSLENRMLKGPGGGKEGAEQGISQAVGGYLTVSPSGGGGFGRNSIWGEHVEIFGGAFFRLVFNVIAQANEAEMSSIKERSELTESYLDKARNNSIYLMLCHFRMYIRIWFKTPNISVALTRVGYHCKVCT